MRVLQLNLQVPVSRLWPVAPELEQPIECTRAQPTPAEGLRALTTPGGGISYQLTGSSTGGSVGDESPSCLRPDRDATFQGESRDPSLGVQSADIAKGAFQPVDCFKVGKQDSIQIEAVQRILVQ
ncbi:hypothetical protein J6590_018983 [Homalodisca vitripennis]|nr:hypothetical protein J6590_018983 [Homalodisca vitripennis]